MLADAIPLEQAMMCRQPRSRMQQTDAVSLPTATLDPEGMRLLNISTSLCVISKLLTLCLRDSNNNNSSKSQPEVADSIKL
jgi:hypothetical protein